jgi:S-DNA-T family DNA segregation ATPase FtsK/SpoIIIE
MIFKAKPAGNRRMAASAPRPLSPRFERLLRESRWLVVVAVLALLALILGSYTPSDPGWSFSGTGAPLANRGGVVGAWIADLLLYLFGASAWWLVAAGAVIVLHAYRRIAEPQEEPDHPLLYGVAGFVLVLGSSAAIESIRLWRLPLALPGEPGGAIGELIGRGLAALLGFNGATLLLLVAFAVGLSLFTGLSWLKLMERIGLAAERTLAWARRKREEYVDRRIGEQSASAREAQVERELILEEEREPIVVVPPVASVPKSDRVVKERQRPLFIDMPDSPLPPLSLLEDAPPTSESVSAETLEFTSRLIERKLAAFGVAVTVLAA